MKHSAYRSAGRERKSSLIELEVTEGLEALTLAEVKQILGNAVTRIEAAGAGAVTFRYTGDLSWLASLNLSSAAYNVVSFPVTRPKALLGDQNWRMLVAVVQEVMRSSRAPYHSLEISAAGSDSGVMRRIATALSEAVQLPAADDKGDLLVRIRRSRTVQGWDVLVRTTPRPTSVRAWRVCNREGALNGPAAYAMNMLTEPVPSDVVVNLGCGSGSLLIERFRCMPADGLIGIDSDWGALACCRENVAASGIGSIHLTAADMTETPLRSQSCDVILADLPFGNLVGSHQENRSLYPAMLAEAARLARPAARLALITHEIRLIEDAFAHSPWQITKSIRISLRGLHPRIYLAVMPHARRE